MNRDRPDHMKATKYCKTTYFVGYIFDKDQPMVANNFEDLQYWKLFKYI
jgi:hypothetical protein